MKEYIFTFGFGQPHEGCYTVIEAENADDARIEMNRRWGNKWSMQYESRDDAGVDEFHLKEIK